jgi:ABC-type branched-subunit amino acid transport system ATPase component/ABC-type branched-subunit amino acid transport system permease subunit
MQSRLLPIFVFAVAMAAIPFVPGIPPFWIVLLDNIGLASLVAMGLVLLTGVGGLTSFGQAAFCGFGAYTTAVLTTTYGVSPWLTLPLSLLVAGFAAVLLGIITMRLSGHYLPLGTIAWGISLFYLFSKLEFLGRNDGISGIPPLSIGTWKMLDPGTIYFPIWIAVIVCAILSMNLLDSRTGRAIRALRRGHVAAEAFGVQTARAKLLVFIYAAVLAGLSGWLYAHFQRAANPTPFGPHLGIEYLFIAVVGGAGYVWGGVLGAAVVIILKEVLQSYLPMLFGGSGQPWVTSLLPTKDSRKRPAATEALPGRAESLPADSILLQVEKARKQFGGVVAVNDVSFEVKSREIVALIGPNGAGKSTTFNLITGVLPATAGKVTVRGESVSGAPPQEVVKLGVARTFHHVKLVPDMTVLENVALGAHLRGSSGAISSMLRLDRADEAKLLAEAAKQIERVGLGDQMNQLAGSLSLGQQRIVEIARALCVDPMLLLLDEPAAGLRHMEKQKLAALLRQLREGGMSVLLVEHDMGFVMNLADRIVVLDFGTKIAEGTPSEIKTNPDVIKAYLGAAA